MAPLVSVVTTCYDSEAYLGRTVQSLLDQTLADWEQVVIDDGSPGDVLATLRPFPDDRIRVVRQPNGGLTNARNAGLRATNPGSRYLLFLDADDVLQPEMMAALVAELDAHPTAGMAFCDRILIDGDDQVIDSYRDDVIRRYVPTRMGVRLLPPDIAATPFAAFYGYSIAVPSLTLLRRSVLEAVGPWDENLGPIYDDTDMWMRISLRSEARYLPRKLLRRRLHTNQLTRSVEGERKRQEAKRRFEQKWLSVEHLSPTDQAVVLRARRFRDGRLLPRLWFSWGRERLRRREVAEAARCVLRGCRLMVLNYPASVL